jgi:hypothetical protein
MLEPTSCVMSEAMRRADEEVPAAGMGNQFIATRRPAYRFAGVTDSLPTRTTGK